MNTCGTCKHFGPLVRATAIDDNGDEVENKRYHACQLVSQIDREKLHAAKTPAQVIDGSDYLAVLCVSEEFGCNQWQPVDSG